MIPTDGSYIDNIEEEGDAPYMVEKVSKFEELAAQAWCTPDTSHIQMDVRLAEAFAKIAKQTHNKVIDECVKAANRKLRGITPECNGYNRCSTETVAAIKELKE